MRTQVAIVGAGPAGTLLSQLLHTAGIDSVVVERQSREHVLGRIRAGVLEWSSVEILRAAGVSANMDRDGVPHRGAAIAWAGKYQFYDILARTGRGFMAYGQSRLQADLYDCADAPVIDEAADVALHDLATERPSLTYTKDGATQRVDADFIVGCDGYHGVSRQSIPSHLVRTYEREYPFGWLGVLSESPPLPELVYCNHASGFALASQRNSMLSRYYVQCPLEDSVDDWPDSRFWPELIQRFPDHIAEQIVTGNVIEKSIAPLRSFVAEPLRYGALFLAGDAAHIVPPTGAKGLNLAISDVHYLATALRMHYAEHDDRGLEHYSDVALRRVWGSVRFSWWLTLLLHRFPGQSDFEQRAREVELDYLSTSEHTQGSFAEQYAGMPLDAAALTGPR